MEPEKYYHLVPEADWRSCVEHGKAYFPATYEADVSPTFRTTERSF